MVLDRNTWSHVIMQTNDYYEIGWIILNNMYKLIVFDRNTWYHITANKWL